MPEDLDKLVEKFLSEKPLLKAVQAIAETIYDQGYRDGYLDGQAEIDSVPEKTNGN